MSGWLVQELNVGTAMDGPNFLDLFQFLILTQMVEKPVTGC